MQPHREDSNPNAVALSVESRMDNSEIGPGVPTGSTVDRTDISTASSVAKDDHPKPQQQQQQQQQQQKQQKQHPPGDQQQESKGSGSGELYREGSIDSGISMTSSTMSPMVPLTNEAYGGGIYGKDDEPRENKSTGSGSGSSGGVSEVGAKNVYGNGSAIPYIR